MTTIPDASLAEPVSDESLQYVLDLLTAPDVPDEAKLNRASTIRLIRECQASRAELKRLRDASDAAAEAELDEFDRLTADNAALRALLRDAEKQTLEAAAKLLEEQFTAYDSPVIKTIAQSVVKRFRSLARGIQIQQHQADLNARIDAAAPPADAGGDAQERVPAK